MNNGSAADRIPAVNAATASFTAAVRSDSVKRSPFSVQYHTGGYGTVLNELQLDSDRKIRWYHET